MSVYVDDFYIMGLGVRNMKMSHMNADTTQELLEMADKIGLQRKWIQYIGTNQEHFDVAMSTRKKAIEAGAIEKPMRELARAVVKRKGPNEVLIFCDHTPKKIIHEVSGNPLLKCIKCGQIFPI